jgi:hypothetical protein
MIKLQEKAVPMFYRRYCQKKEHHFLRADVLEGKKIPILLPKRYCLPSRTIFSTLLMSIPKTGGLMKNLIPKRQNKHPKEVSQDDILI